LICIIWNIGPGPDDAHRAQQYIKQLRQFVKFIFPKESPGPRYRRDIIRSNGTPYATARIHCLDLIYLDDFAMPTDPLMYKKSIATRFNGRDNPAQEDYRKKNNHANERKENVKSSFQQKIRCGHYLPAATYYAHAAKNRCARIG
jgi:hypothetical protein